MSKDKAGIKDKSTVIVPAIAAFILLGCLVSLLFKKEIHREPREHFRSVIELKAVSDTTSALVVGYNYFILEQFAQNQGVTMDISIARRGESFLDSLKRGSIDLLVLPFSEDNPALGDDSLLVSRPLDSLSVFVMRESENAEMQSLNIWLEAWSESESYEATRDSYLRRYNVYRSRRRSTISPYDSLIRHHADSLGWDWRMLAAVIYQESRFHIEATSRRGARGLMQMMPSTARHYGLLDPLDPAENIAAGARLLGSLMRRYRKVGENPEEIFKYALAAYNAGVGRIDDILALARHRGVDTGRWENVLEVIPEMNDPEALDSTGIVKLGVFKGKETIAYVDEVISVYEQFLRICP